MPTAIYDASLITFRKRASVLYGFNANMKAAAAANYHVIQNEQPTFQTAEILLTRKQGGCFCSQDASGIPFNSRTTSGACGCAR